MSLPGLSSFIYQTHIAASFVVWLSDWKFSMGSFDVRARAVDLHLPLETFCTLALELYPTETWTTVEPKLARSWDRSRCRGPYEWAVVRDAVRARWVMRPR